MTPKELMKVKQYQREFQSLFNKCLEIDFIAMNGVEVTGMEEVDADIVAKQEVDLENLLNSCVAKYEADIDKIKERRKRLQVGAFTKERAAVREFSKLVVYLKCNIHEAAKLINRDRSVIYHYAGMR